MSLSAIVRHWMPVPTALRFARKVMPFLGVLAGPVFMAAETADGVHGYKKLTLQELMDVEVVSVSRRPEKLSETASAIYVITHEQIRRSGATNVPDALRLAPNLHVGQVSSSSWTIGARGFNSTNTTSNKLLVMIDGRSVYSPLFSGVFWDTQDVFLPDLDRIEVISGPGGATWGANAVNGIINVLTKSARETQGGLAYGGGGGEERRFGGVRYGGRVGAGGHYRIYAKHFDVDGFARPDGSDARDRHVMTQVGFRTDWDLSESAQLTVQGDAYNGWIAQPTAPRGELSGANLLARWTRTHSTDSQIQVQAYYDYARRWATNTFADWLETFDLDAQHQLSLGGRHRIVWGVNYRLWLDEVRNSPTQAFMPAADTVNLGSMFVQDEFELVPERLRVTLGIKLEHSDYSGFEYQPSARLAWLVTEKHTLWSAVSRAVRTPSRLDRDLYQPTRAPFVIAGGPNFSSEILWAYEAGWRGRFTERTSGAVTYFYHDYDDLRSVEPTGPLPLVFANGIEAQTYGVELSLEQEVTSWWRLRAAYALLRRELSYKPGGRDLNQLQSEISDPENEATLHTSFDLPGRIELDGSLRYVDDVPTFANGQRGFVPSYTELDARIAWHARDDLELSVVGRSLLDRQHRAAGAGPNRREIERSVHGKATWRF
jgi:iron complex outermembrane recepter protein